MKGLRKFGGGRPFTRPPTLRHVQEGRWGYILAWLVGVPVPILIVIYLLRGCTSSRSVSGRRRQSSRAAGIAAS
jgi:hypothetical protein